MQGIPESASVGRETTRIFISHHHRIVCQRDGNLYQPAALTEITWINYRAASRERLIPDPHLFLYFLPCCLFYLAAEIVSLFTTIRCIDDLGALYCDHLDLPHGVLALQHTRSIWVRDLVPGWAGIGGERFTFWRQQEPIELLLSLGVLSYVRERRIEE